MEKGHLGNWESVPWDLFHSTQLVRYSEASLATIPGGLVTAQANSRVCCHPYGPGFASMQNARLMKSGRLPSRFWKKVCVVRQYSEGIVHESVRVELIVH